MFALIKLCRKNKLINEFIFFSRDKQDVESPDNNEDQPGQSTAPPKKNEKALLARVWGNFDSK